MRSSIVDQASTLRQHGILARSRVGFCGYFDSGWHTDHVVVELIAEPRTPGARLYDAELVPADHSLDTTGQPTRRGPSGPYECTRAPPPEHAMG